MLLPSLTLLKINSQEFGLLKKKVMVYWTWLVVNSVGPTGQMLHLTLIPSLNLQWKLYSIQVTGEFDLFTIFYWYFFPNILNENFQSLLVSVEVLRGIRDVFNMTNLIQTQRIEKCTCATYRIYIPCQKQTNHQLTIF